MRRLAPVRRAVAAELRGLRRIARAGRGLWRSAPVPARVVGAVFLAGVVAVGVGVPTWAALTVARLDLDAAQETPLVYAAGRRLAPGVSVRAIADSLDRLAYREVSGEPGAPGEFHRTRGRWEVHLRARPDLRRPAVRVTFLDEGARVREVVGAPGGAEPLELEPELLTGIGDTGAERRRPLALADLSPFVTSAVLAAEDHRFFEHAGVDLMAVGRAFAVNASRGEIAQGASTLTQQLVKNLALGPERTWSRKIREGVLAIALERWRSKEQILEAYLNTVYLGQHERAAIHGVGAAAQGYFGKDARRLTAGESALLAGMIRAPNRYSPLEHPERARHRRDVVLHQMQALGFIDRPTLDAALAERVRVRGVASVPSPAPYFLDHVRVAAATELRAGSPRIDTTLDPILQRAAEGAVSRGLDRLETAHRRLRRSLGGERLQVALVALDPGTGAIRAMVGGRDHGLSAFNRVTHARRQPGSAFKPFVFLAALRWGAGGEPPVATPTSLVEDLPIEVETPQAIWAPRNFEDRFEGVVTVRRALEQSSNAVTIRLAQAVGLDRVVRTARDVGFTSRMAPVPALALGSFEVTPLELASAYAALANGGWPVAAHGVRSIDGRAPSAAVLGAPSLSAAEAYLLTHLLRGVVDRGTGAAVRALGLQGAVAGKTGTTNETRDAWFAGYSPRLVAVVWVGFDDGTPLELPGSRAALPIWTDFMRAAAALEDPGEFVVPSSVSFARACGQIVLEAFLPLTEPPPPCAPTFVAPRPPDAPSTLILTGPSDR